MSANFRYFHSPWLESQPPAEVFNICTCKSWMRAKKLTLPWRQHERKFRIFPGLCRHAHVQAQHTHIFSQAHTNWGVHRSRCGKRNCHDCRKCPYTHANISLTTPDILYSLIVTNAGEENKCHHDRCAFCDCWDKKRRKMRSLCMPILTFHTRRHVSFYQVLTGTSKIWSKLDQNNSHSQENTTPHHSRALRTLTATHANCLL